jgi:hypothetical protein
MVKPMDPNRHVPFYLPEDLDEDGRPTPDATLFMLGVLTARQVAYLSDRLTVLRGQEGGVSVEERGGTRVLLMLQMGLRDISGHGWVIRDEDRVATPGDPRIKGLSEAVLDRLPLLARVKLAEEIDSIAMMTEDDLGNCLGRYTSSSATT